MALSKYFTEDRAFTPIALEGFPPFYVLNPDAVNPREIEGLFTIPDHRERTILRALGAQRAYFKTHRLEAGIPFLLSHLEDTGKPCSSSFVRVKDDLLQFPQRLQEVVYDLSRGLRDVCIDDLLDYGQGPKGYNSEIPLGSDFVVPVERFGFSEDEDGSNRTFHTTTVTRICFDDWYITTALTTYFHQRADRVFGFSLQYWIPPDNEESSVSALRTKPPAGDFYMGRDNSGKFKVFGTAAEVDLSNGKVNEKLRVVSGGLVVSSRGSLPLEEVLDASSWISNQFNATVLERVDKEPDIKVALSILTPRISVFMAFIVLRKVFFASDH